MKRNALLIIIALVALAVCAPASFAQKKDKSAKDKDSEPGEQVERTIAASQNVVVTLCMASGDIQVHGWDRSEIKVVATSVRQLELQGGGANPAQRVEVVLSNAPKSSPEEPLVCDCRGVSDMEIDVPRGATVEIKTRSGDIEVSQVAEARIDNTSGDISLSKVTRAVEANTISGDVSISDSSGRIRLRSISGDVEANNIHPVGASDDFSAHSTSGDISLDDVSQARLTANTTSGMITMTGRLAQRGSYDLNSFSGDVVLNIPADSSFKLNAISQQGSINTDFAIKSAGDEDSQNLLEGRSLTGTVGTGDASIMIKTFNGTVRLQKR
jgi:hypothetical protein